MPWIILLISAILEAVWATALGRSEGLTVLAPSIVFLVTLAASMATLGYVTRHIPISTAYAIWAGLGAAFTVSYSMLTGGEAVTALRLLFLAGIVGSVIALKLLKSAQAPPPARRQRPAEPDRKAVSKRAASPAPAPEIPTWPTATLPTATRSSPQQAPTSRLNPGGP